MELPQLQQTRLALQLGHCFALGATKRPQLQQNPNMVDSASSDISHGARITA